MRPLALLYCFGASLPLLAQSTYYVSPDGDDAAAGTSLGAAFRTFSRGIEALEAGDSLLVGDGVYREAYLVVDGLIATAERPTVIKSINRWGAKIEGVIYHGVLLKIIGCDHLVVEGFEAYHPGESFDTDWVAGIGSFESDYVTYRDNYVHDCGCGGFSMRTGDYFTFERNVAAGNARFNVYNCSGISVLQPRARDTLPGPHVVIRDNVTFGNECRQPFLPMGFSVPTDGNGIILDDFEQSHSYTTDGIKRPPYRQLALIENNLSFGNGGAGIKSYETARVIFRNNTAYHNNEVLSEQGGGLFSEIGAEAVTGHVEMTGNIAVKAFGRAGNALYFKPKPGDDGAAARLTARGNLVVGRANLTGAALDPAANTLRGEDEQGYARFVDPRDTVPADATFASVDDFRRYFGLRQNSPGVDRLPDDFPADDLAGVARPVGPRADLGAYEGAVVTDRPLAPDPVLTAEIHSTPEPLAVDGVREGYYSAEPQPIRKPLATRAAAAGLAATWYGAYDATRLYLLVEATDPSPDPGDAVEVRLGGAHGAPPLTVELPRTGPPILDGGMGRETARVDASGRATGGGYAYEFAIPWGAFGAPPPRDGGDFPIEVVLRDRQTGSGETPALSWRNADPAHDGQPAHFGRGVLREVAPPPSLPRLADAPTLDGDADAPWADVPAHDLTHRITGSVAEAADLSAAWRAAYDAEALYLRVDVRDEAASADDGTAQWYRDDGVEVYLDLDNAKTFGAYDADDRQISVGLDGRLRVTKGPDVPGARAAVRETDGGYVAEVSLPWAGLGASPEAGKFLGLDVHVLDDDDGGPVDGKLSWFSEQDQAHANARLFGTVALGR